MIRWLVTGAGGMLGSDLCRRLAGHDVLAATRADLDVRNSAAVHALMLDTVPDVVVNLAAWTNVDSAEQNEATAFDINATGAANVARACGRVRARLVQVSTDYVFDGNATSPYAEDAVVRPLSAYGRTKAAGEWAVRALLPDASWIVRTAWLYGAQGHNFVKTMIALEGARDQIEVVNDQRGQPTWTVDAAEAIVRLVDAGASPGVYHATSAGEATWYTFARAIFSALSADPDRIRPTTMDRLSRPAPRPAYSVLSHGAWARESVAPLPDWWTSFDQAFETMRLAS
jgi:dTDP-4-dehydrorhamnose reductase